MDFELLTCLLKFIEHFPDYLSVLSRMLLRFFWTTFVETAVYVYGNIQISWTLDNYTIFGSFWEFLEHF